LWRGRPLCLWPQRRSGLHRDRLAGKRSVGRESGHRTRLRVPGKDQPYAVGRGTLNSLEMGRGRFAPRVDRKPSSLSNIRAPGRIGSMDLRNRMFVTAMGVSLAEDDGTAGDRLIAYHEEQARGGAALIITGV